MEPKPATRPAALALKRAFGDVLRELRQEKQLSQDRLAELSHCHVNQISFLERGINGPSLDLVFRLADGLGLSATDLIQRVEDRIRAAMTEGHSQ